MGGGKGIGNHKDAKTQRRHGSFSDAIRAASFELESLAKQVIHLAFRVHSNLGPGLLESVYEACLCFELSRAGIAYERQQIVPVIYEGMTIDAGLRIDILVGGQLVLELKAVEEMIPLYNAQLLTYLKLTGRRLGLLINFNVPLFKDGISRVIR
jgi:GxxExxY protein